MTEPVVLVPLDGLKDAPNALPIARRLAELAKARVQTLDVPEEAGPPAEAILAAASDAGARLIVMCAHATDAQPAGALDAAAVAVVRAAACPVVLVAPIRAPADWTLTRVLAAHDGSPSVSNALSPAAELAREARAEFVAMHMAGDARDLETGSIAAPRYLDQVQHEWPAWSAEYLQRLGCICPLADTPTRLLVRQGVVADETINAARDEAADLVVLTWRGRWEAPQTAMLAAMLQGAPCPIMVARVLDR
jgi:nucleotide-binding universal stress UspA family protein